MDETTYQAWWPLHLRAASGEALSAEEQAQYDEGKRRLREAESWESGLVQLRQTRAEIAALEAQRERLQAEREQWRERVRTLETALNENEKRLIGAGR